MRCSALAWLKAICLLSSRTSPTEQADTEPSSVHDAWLSFASGFWSAPRCQAPLFHLRQSAEPLFLLFFPRFFRPYGTAGAGVRDPRLAPGAKFLRRYAA